MKLIAKNGSFHNVSQGNSLELMSEIPDGSIDLIFADLPFGSTNCKWDKKIPMNRYVSVEDRKKVNYLYLKDFLLEAYKKGIPYNEAIQFFEENSKDGLWQHYLRVLKKNGCVLLNSQGAFTNDLIDSNPKMYKYTWIWEKTQATGHLNAKKRPMSAHEEVLVFYKEQPTYNPQKTKGHVRKVSTARHKRNTSTGEIYGKCDDFSDYDSTERYPRSVQVFKSDKQKLNVHSTQKPLSMVKYFIETYTNPNDTILDNTMGSATTIVGSMELNRNSYGYELDEDIFLNRAIPRINKFL